MKDDKKVELDGFDKALSAGEKAVGAAGDALDAVLPAAAKGARVGLPLIAAGAAVVAAPVTTAVVVGGTIATVAFGASLFKPSDKE